MGEHKRVLTHVNRTFVNKNVSCDSVNTELQASRDQWTRWFVVNKSFNTKIKNKTFAQVLTTGKSLDKRQERGSCQGVKHSGESKTVTSPYHNSECIPCKWVQAKRNGHVIHRIDNSSSNAGTGKLRISSNTQSYQPVNNRFQLLADIQNDNVQNCHGAAHDIFENKLEGNKNKTGSKLGKSCESNDVAHLTSLQGNKNKKGQTLGQATQANCAKATDNGHKAQFQFRGNKTELGQNWALSLRMTVARK